MGCCSSHPADDDTVEQNPVIQVPRGGNRRFIRKNIKWTAESSMTMGQLQSQRDAFWDTAPSYEGRREIWQALRAAVEAQDLKLAQSILDAANITMPTGSPADGCYDELGNRYVIPTYCLVEPTNMIRSADGDDNGDDSSASNLVVANASIATDSRNLLNASAEQASSSSSAALAPSTPTQPIAVPQPTSTSSTPVPHSLTKPTSLSASSSTPVPTSPIATPTILAEGDHPILIRLSSGRDIPILVSSAGTDTIVTLRARLYAHPDTGAARETHNIRFFYLGRLLEDRTRIVADQTSAADAMLGAGFAEKGVVRIPRDGVVQALVSEKLK
ncbi:hypothetical protein BC938DRAFT_482511 [Jimgerdemannia flammicorona]|uniref:DC-UbP/UBTD2 N-terminal domain-containing protein n=1 Tax=Jimgerdemannia flammicorona TaxID=994334 RepID=A0A433QDY0_9FUNG|nr:hypothetical protein BC938DRAFT_482511 [Jimgerdemannia flammicorona]